MLRFLRKSRRASGKKETCLETRLQAMEARLRALEAAVGGQVAGGDLEQAERAEDTAHEEAQGGSVPSADDDLEQCVLGESIWDSPAFMGLPGFGDRLTTLLLILTLLASVGIQAFFCYTLVTNTNFYDPGYWEKTGQTAEKWRLSDAHDHRYSGGGVSLASRVCNDDSSLSLAASQRELLGDIDNYMDHEVWWRASGPRLALFSVTLFVLMVMEEQRSALLCMRALLTLPIGRTSIQENHLASISKPRLVASFAVSLVRFAISVAVLCAGLVWLVTTAKASDLILNNAALGFVFAIDELLVNALVPAATQNRLRTMEPVRVKRLPWHLEAVLPWAVTAAVAVAVALLQLQPQAADMVATRSALCGGRTDFTVFLEPEKVVTHDYTRPFSPEVTRDLRTKALEELRASGPQDEATWRPYSLSVINRGHGQWGENEVGKGPCTDSDADAAGYGYLHSAVQEVTGVFRSPFACEDYTGFCKSTQLMRMACPETCGCRLESWSGLFETNGCPESCRREGQERAASAACSDRHVVAEYREDLRRTYVAAATQIYSEERIAAELAWIDTALAGSCSAVGLHTLCDENHPWLAGTGGTTVHRFCPELCCNGNYTDPQGLCPRSCPASAKRG